MPAPRDSGAGQPPTLRDVAERAGVSAMTASRVLRDDPRVLPATRDRVRAAAAALGYRPNEVARSLRLGRGTGLVGLVVTYFYVQTGLEGHGPAPWLNGLLAGPIMRAPFLSAATGNGYGGNISGPADAVITVSGNKASGTMTVRQSDWGIKPFSALMGALKLADQLTIAVEATVPGSFSSNLSPARIWARTRSRSAALCALFAALISSLSWAAHALARRWCAACLVTPSAEPIVGSLPRYEALFARPVF